jgi:3-methylfumaryl-CoA hydratase
MMIESNPYSGWLGKSRWQHDSMAVEVLQRFAALMDRDPVKVVEGDPLPPCAHWFYFNPVEVQGALAGDGHPHKGDFLPPVDLPRRMWAGGNVRILRGLRAGQPAMKSSTITAIQPKSGKTGALCFVTVLHRIESGGQVCIEEDQHIVYREAHDPAHPPRRQLAYDGPRDWSDSWTPDSVALFRFSALTYNGHRIHYDAPYCRLVEGYPDLVVHGPYLVHKILESFAVHHPDRCLIEIDYRAMGPVYNGETVSICATSTSAGCTEMRVLGPEGNVAMFATLTWEA